MSFPPHHDHDYLDALYRVRAGRTNKPADLMKAIAAVQSCRMSGLCAEKDKHEAEITRYFSQLTGGRDG